MGGYMSIDKTYPLVDYVDCCFNFPQLLYPKSALTVTSGNKTQNNENGQCHV